MVGRAGDGSSASGAGGGSSAGGTTGGSASTTGAAGEGSETREEGGPAEEIAADGTGDGSRFVLRGADGTAGGDAGGGADAGSVADVAGGALTSPISPGLHNLYTEAVRASNDDLGLNPDDLGLNPDDCVSVLTLAQSPPFTFFKNCSFYTDMDLDTADPDQLSCQTDSFITAAFRAGPKVAPSVRRVRG
ncbi:hypothetical protein I4F81_008948 [Pyropia yezoensis]|uniref:Uncharacterized protein n=1 Tax=Pyropia yezoensis TaxID=2788 RepID=A0ACC3C972_PYRYE|nr:hypothetical protein I4F81_008948 [Neopyropia yezoensis]